MKGIPLAYNKDMQEDKELTFDAIDTVKGCIALFTGMVSTMQFNKAENMIVLSFSGIKDVKIESGIKLLYETISK